MTLEVTFTVSDADEDADGDVRVDIEGPPFDPDDVAYVDVEEDVVDSPDGETLGGDGEHASTHVTLQQEEFGDLLQFLAAAVKWFFDDRDDGDDSQVDETLY